ncbi:MAG: hypothetical protein ACI9G1_001187 [Pirellulaceae bacterium]|jgi:hypothetical protein
MVWLMMCLAFGTAWTFIVKGCEAMDDAEEATRDTNPPTSH